MVIINNDGGGIFHRLPISKFDPPFQELFVTPHGLDFEPIVRGYGARFLRVEARRGQIAKALSEALLWGESAVLEVRTDAERHERIRREILQTVGETLKREG